VVGTGFLGAQRAAAIAAARGSRLVAVHDRDWAAATRTASRFGALPIARFEEALERSDVDAVIVATPHADHDAQARAALEAGKHVLVEKPLAIHAEDAYRLAFRADELKLRLATGLNHRFYPPVTDALRLSDAGALGGVETVRAEIGHRASAEFLSSWHTDLERSGGGTLMDNGPHGCDLIRRFLGEVVAAKGYVRDCPGLPAGCEVEAFALFRSADAGIAELRSSWTQPSGYLTLEVRGTQGWLRVETAPWSLRGVVSGGRAIRRSYLADRVAARIFRRRFGCERSLVDEIEAFVAAIAGRPTPAADGWDGCRATEMIQGVFRSVTTGAEVRLEPALWHASTSARRSVQEASIV
jgi:predicted dehydrogenase